MTDQYIHYLEVYEAVKQGGMKLMEKMKDLNQRIVIFYDEASNFAGMLVKVLQDKQEELIKYVKETYSNV